jgi:hypothetical protein
MASINMLAEANEEINGESSRLQWHRNVWPVIINEANIS